MRVLGVIEAEPSEDALFNSKEIVLHQLKTHGSENETEQKVERAQDGFAVLVVRQRAFAGNEIAQADGRERNEGEVSTVHVRPAFPVREEHGAGDDVQCQYAQCRCHGHVLNRVDVHLEGAQRSDARETDSTHFKREFSRASTSSSSSTNGSTNAVDGQRVVLDEEVGEEIAGVRQAHDHDRYAEHGVDARHDLAESRLGCDVAVADGGDHRGREEHGGRERPLLIVGDVGARVVLVRELLLFGLHACELLVDEPIEPFALDVHTPAGIIITVLPRDHPTPQGVA